MARKKESEKSMKEVYEGLPEEEKEKIAKELEDAASKVDLYSLDDVLKPLDKFLDDFSERMDKLAKEFADIFCGEEQEEEKMEPTSKQVINGVNNLRIYQDPDGRSTKLTLRNDDDTFEIEINGEEAYKAFGRLIFADHNIGKLKEDKEYAEKLNKELIDRWTERTNVLREENDQLKKHNQELADEIIAVRKENIELMQSNELLKTENQHLREDIMRVKDEISRCNKVNEDLGRHAIELEKKIHNMKLEKKMRFVNENSTYGIDPVPEKLLTRSDILKMADKCTNGNREQDYGSPENNFQLIADIWNAICQTDIFTPELVSLCMIGMKSARIINGGGTGDSWVDICGYAACGGEINARRKQAEKSVPKGE